MEDRCENDRLIGDGREMWKMKVYRRLNPWPPPPPPPPGEKERCSGRDRGEGKLLNWVLVQLILFKIDPTQPKNASLGYHTPPQATSL